MDAQELLDQARDAITVKRVFGEPYERDGVTIIPVASVMGGAGAGGGTGPARAGWGGRRRMGGASPEAAGADTETGTEGGAEELATGYGSGYGVRATPAGVYVISNGEVEWRPAIDANRALLVRAMIAVLGLLVARSIIRTIAGRG